MAGRPVGTISPKSYAEDAFSSDVVDAFERFATFAAPLLAAALAAGGNATAFARSQKRGILQGIALVKARAGTASSELEQRFPGLFDAPIAVQGQTGCGIIGTPEPAAVSCCRRPEQPANRKSRTHKR
jgi:hypothetical protein